MRNVLLISALAMGFGACTRGVLLYETTPVIVQANPPAPPPAPTPVAEPIVVRDAIHFDTNRDTIKAESLAVLDDVASQIKSHPELIKIRVEGHTDNVGKRDDNISLSRRRAIAVREYLVSKAGIDAERLLAEGYGPDNPIANNETEVGRAKNRRVAFTVLDRTDALGTAQTVVSYGGNQ
jgi:outer membrane protein OmpA-like peptidoglycan-associated protein